MARAEGGKIVKPKVSAGTGSFADLRKGANHQSPMSMKYEDARKYAKGKSGK